MKKTVPNSGKQQRNSKRNARRAFDQVMNQRFGSIHCLNVSDLEWVKKLDHFNIKRLAHWVNKHSKKLAQDCLSWIKNQFNTLGGLSVQRHFA